MAETCGNCRYGGACAVLRRHASEAKGIVCRRMPAFENKHRDDWCGEWKEADPEAEA